MTTYPSDGVGPVEVVRGYLEAINARDPDAVAALVTDDFVNEHVAERGDSLRGRQAYRRRLDGFLRSFPVLHYEIEDVVSEGAKVVVAYRMRGTRASGDEGGAGQPIDVRGVFRFVVVKGRIAHRVDYRDSATVERQLGLRP